MFPIPIILLFNCINLKSAIEQFWCLLIINKYKNEYMTWLNVTEYLCPFVVFIILIYYFPPDCLPWVTRRLPLEEQGHIKTIAILSISLLVSIFTSLLNQKQMTENNLYFISSWKDDIFNVYGNMYKIQRLIR